MDPVADLIERCIERYKDEFFEDDVTQALEFFEDNPQFALESAKKYQHPVLWKFLNEPTELTEANTGVLINEMVSLALDVSGLRELHFQLATMPKVHNSGKVSFKMTDGSTYTPSGIV